MNASNCIRRLGWILCLLACPVAAHGQPPGHEGDVTDVRMVRHVEKHPQAWRLWQPYIIQSTRKGQLIVAFGAMRNGKKDMGDILAAVSKDDGDTWQEPVTIFDHNVRQGAIQFAYANPMLYRVPGQEVIWCFAMRCPIAYKNSYPTLCEVAPGDFRAVWDSGTADTARTHIHFGKLKIKP